MYSLSRSNASTLNTKTLSLSSSPMSNSPSSPSFSSILFRSHYKLVFDTSYITTDESRRTDNHLSSTINTPIHQYYVPTAHEEDIVIITVHHHVHLLVLHSNDYPRQWLVPYLDFSAHRHFGLFLFLVAPCLFYLHVSCYNYVVNIISM